MSIAEDVRLLIADNFIKSVRELERSGVRHDLVLDGLEQALMLLKERDREFGNPARQIGASDPSISRTRDQSL